MRPLPLNYFKFPYNIMGDYSSDEDVHMGEVGGGSDGAFHDLCEEGDVDGIITMMELNNVEEVLGEPDYWGCSPVMCAILSAKIDVLKVLVNTPSKGRLDFSHNDGAFPLHMAVTMGSIPKHRAFALEAVNLLLNEGQADPAVFDDYRRSPLFIAATLDLPQVVQSLLSVGGDVGVEVGKDVLTVTDDFGFTPLAAAASYGSVKCVEIIVSAAPDMINVGTIRGDMPLHLAAFNGHSDIVKVLLGHGADASLLNCFNLKASEVASRRGFHAVAALITGSSKSLTSPSSKSVKGHGIAEGKTALVNHPICLEHYTCPNPITRSGNPPPNENIGRLLVLVDPEYGLLKATEFDKSLLWMHSPQRANIGDILRVHDYQYVRKIQNICAAIEDNPRCIANIDSDTAVSHRSYEAALRAAGSAIEAVTRVCKGEVRNAFCAVRPPGHHAGPSGLVSCKNNCVGSHGFCLLNNVAIAAAYARANFGDLGINKVAILDFDVHHGNGTEAIIRNIIPNTITTTTKTSLCDISLRSDSCKPWRDESDGENIFFASVHGFGREDPYTPHYFYPGSGASIGLQGPDLENISDLHFDDSEGGGTIDFDPLPPTGIFNSDSGATEAVAHKEATIINVGLGKRSRVTWRKMWRDEILHQLLEFKPDLILISAGFDGHKKDYINGGYLGLVEEDYYWLTNEIVKVANTVCHGRVVSVLEGGYKIDGKVVSAFARSVASHVRALASPAVELHDEKMWELERVQETKEANLVHDDEYVDPEELAELQAEAEALEAEGRAGGGGAAEAAGSVAAPVSEPGDDDDDNGGRRKRRRTAAPVDYVRLNEEMEAEKKRLKLAAASSSSTQ